MPSADVLRVLVLLCVVVAAGCTAADGPAGGPETAAPTTGATESTTTANSTPDAATGSRAGTQNGTATRESTTTEAATRTPMSDWSGAANLTGLAVGDEVTDPPEWRGGDRRPTVETTESGVVVTGRIAGVGDASCIVINGTTATASNGTLTLTVRSDTSYAQGACNQTLLYWPYRATVDVDGPLPTRVRVTHVDGDGDGDDPRALRTWTVGVDANRKASNASRTA